MQSNEIILSIDLLNSGVTTNSTFSRFEEYLNRSVYIGANHALDSRDTLTLYRTPPKPNGNFKGVAKVAAKFTEDFSVNAADGTTMIVPALIQVSCSIPVGLTPAQTLALRQKLLALIDKDTVMAPLFDIQMI